MIAGLGIDILSLKRADRFLKEHLSSDQFFHFFSEDEKKEFSSATQWTPMRFAKLFTAKEAFFKALSLHTFQWDHISVKNEGENYFKATYQGEASFHKNASGCFFVSEEYVGAQVIICHE